MNRPALQIVKRGWWGARLVGYTNYDFWPDTDAVNGHTRTVPRLFEASREDHVENGEETHHEERDVLGNRRTAVARTWCIYINSCMHTSALHGPGFGSKPCSARSPPLQNFAVWAGPGVKYCGPGPGLG